MKFVVDASVALAWSLPDEASQEADHILSLVEEHGAVAPVLFKAEVANVLSLAAREKRITPETCEAALAALSDLGVAFDIECLERVWSEVIELADRFRLSIYDALYLEVAMRRGLRLATFDAQLRRAAEQAGIPLMAAAR